MEELNRRIKTYQIVSVLLLGFLIIFMTGCGKNKSEEKVDPQVTKEESKEEKATSRIELKQNTDHEIEVIATGFVADILNKEFKKAYEDYTFTKEMKAAIDEAALGQILIATKMQYGEFIGQLTNYIVEADDYNAVFVQLEFEKDKMAFQVSFDMENKIAGFFFKEYKEMDDTTSVTNSDELAADDISMVDGDYEELEFGLAEYLLPATLSTTKETNLIVVMVHGSGPNDRDVTIGPNKVFKDIEQGLLAENVGSFRYDKRTLVYGSKIAADNTFGLYEETVEDCVLAVKKIREIYGKAMKVVVLGHSQGGYSIPFIAKELDKEGLEVNGYIIMAGNYSPIYKLIERQIEYLGKLDGDFSDEEKKQLKDIVDGFEPLINGEEVDADTSFFYATAGYWKTFIDYKIDEDIKYMTQPTLVLNGDRDYQVPFEEVELWRQVLNKDKSEFQIFKGLNHLMIKGEGEPNPQEYYKQGHVDDEVIKRILDFLSGL